MFFFFFFFNDTATTEIYTLSLHDALPIWIRRIAINTGGGDAPGLNAVIRAATLAAHEEGWEVLGIRRGYTGLLEAEVDGEPDRKSTRLNSSHANISYAVFCLKKKKNNVSH